MKFDSTFLPTLHKTRANFNSFVHGGCVKLDGSLISIDTVTKDSLSSSVESSGIEFYELLIGEVNEGPCCLYRLVHGRYVELQTLLSDEIQI